jgi:hypothetical protein
MEHLSIDTENWLYIDQNFESEIKGADQEIKENQPAL